MTSQIVLRNVHLTASPSNAVILKDLTCSIPQGSLTALMGPSGSGKTSLLNVLTSRLPENVVFRGHVTFPETVNARAHVGYVTQGDFLIPHLTIRETFEFAASLALPVDMPDSEKRAKALAVATQLGLINAYDVLVGDENNVVGLSGGQKRRVSIGVQLISSPTVLILDEPTTGLDAFAALSVMETLKYLTQTHNMTILVAIHQPRCEVFDMFHCCLLLSQGQVVYSGTRARMYDYFSSLGFPCPECANPADFFIDISSLDLKSSKREERSRQRVASLLRSYHELADECKVEATSEQELGVNANVPFSNPQPDFSFFSTIINMFYRIYVEVCALTTRNLTIFAREKYTWLSGFVQSMCLSLMMGIIYFQVPSDLAGLRSRVTCLYMTTTFGPYMALIYQTHLNGDMLVTYDLEKKDKRFGAFAYLFSRSIAALPNTLIFPIFGGLLMYYMIGLRTDSADYVLIFLVGQVLAMTYVTMLGNLVSAIARPFAVSSLIANSLFTFSVMTCGMFVQSSTLPAYINWFKYCSFIYYSFRLTASNDLTDNNAFLTSCPSYPTGNCNLYTGNQLLEDYGISRHDTAVPITALLCWIIILFMSSVLILEYWVPGEQQGMGNVETTMTEEEEEEVEALQGKGERVEVLQGKGERVEKDVEDGREMKECGREDGGGTDGNKRGNVIVELEMSPRRIVNDVGTIVAPPRRKIVHRAKVTVNLNEISLYVKNGRETSIREKDEHWAVNEGLETSNCDAGVSNVGSVCLLNQISAKLEPGQLWAVMGGSGSGKTSLLAIVSQRITADVSGGHEMSGSVLFNGKAETAATITDTLGYVTQGDYHLPSLTVRETLLYAADLRLAGVLTQKEKELRVDSIIRELGLTLCADRLVGSPLAKGISGGEKRRLSIGIQLVREPAVLLVDEPTSGLDSFTAHNVVRTIKRLAERGRTVLMTIHQPRADIFQLFDHVMVLSSANVIYSGSPGHVKEYFSKFQIVPPCPIQANPADWLLDISSVDFRSADSAEKSKARIAVLVNARVEKKAGQVFLVENCNNESASLITPCCASFSTLLQRSLTNLIRQPEVVSARFGQVIAFALIQLLFYAPLGNDYYGVLNRIGISHMSLSFASVGMLNSIACFPQERNLFYREKADGVYSTEPFFFTYLCIEVPMNILCSVIGAAIVSVGSGLHDSVEAFFIYAFVVFVLLSAGESLGIAFCAIFSHAGFAVTQVSVVIAYLNITAGLFFPTKTLPLPLQYVNSISILHYCANILGIMAFSETTFTCSNAQLVGGVCPYTTGESVIALYGWDQNLKYVYCGVAFLIVVIFRGVAYLLLHYHQPSLSAARN